MLFSLLYRNQFSFKFFYFLSLLRVAKGNCEPIICIIVSFLANITADNAQQAEVSNFTRLTDQGEAFGTVRLKLGFIIVADRHV